MVLSLALYGDRQAQLCTLTNVLGKTVAPLVVHFSFVGGQRMAAEARAVLLGSCLAPPAFFLCAQHLHRLALYR